MATRKVTSGTAWELRFYSNPNKYEVVDTYFNPGLAYGMRLKKNAELPRTYPLDKLKVVQV